MKIRSFCSLLLLFLSVGIFGFEARATQQKVMIFIIDGVRPREVTSAYFPSLKRLLSKNPSAKIFGAPGTGQTCVVSNPFRISLPAYADILSGVRQESVTKNILEGPMLYSTWIDQLMQKGWIGSMFSLFTSWERIPVVVSKTAIPEGMVISSGLHPGETAPPWRDARYDLDTIKQINRHFFEEKRQSFYTMIVFNDTDEWAHKNDFENYGRAIRGTEQFIASTIEKLEELPFYRGQTTYLVTTDHGRGLAADNFHGHNAEIEGSQYIWAMVIPSASAKLNFASVEPEGECTQLGLTRMVMQVL